MKKVLSLSLTFYIYYIIKFFNFQIVLIFAGIVRLFRQIKLPYFGNKLKQEEEKC